ncbi:MAG: hypothetical protein U0T81_12235 [Saprospiraceae bacterium]
MRADVFYLPCPPLSTNCLNPFSLSATELLSLSFGLLMVGLWVSECFPMPVVGSPSSYYFSSYRPGYFGNVSNCYSDPVIYLFMGGFSYRSCPREMGIAQKNLITDPENNRI